MDTFALLDEGSTITLINKKTARDIGVRGPRVELRLRGIRGREAILSNSEKVEIQIQGAAGKLRIKNAVAVQDLNLPCQSLPDEAVKHIEAVENIKMQPYYKAQPRILIGQDNWHLIATRELREMKGIGLALSRSLLGWSLHGLKRGELDATVTLTTYTKRETGEDGESLDALIKQYFQIDSLGVSENVKANNRHDRAQKALEETSRRTGRSWEVGLLWTRDRIPEVDSWKTARKRLASLERRLDRDPEYALLYYKEMHRFIAHGYAIKAGATLESSRVWYLPHFGVVNVNKPNKVRIVFDAAAKTEGISLNDQLDSGPDLLQSLAGVLMRFRQHEIAVKADITDMFLRVRVRKEDRAAQRFMWRGEDRRKDPEVYEMTSLIFGAKSSPSSAIYVKDKNAKSFAESKPEAAESIVKNSYMDDYLVSRKTVQEAKDLIHDVIQINSEGNFEMHGWASNAACGLGAICEPSKDQGEARLCDRGGEKVLGLFWDTETDELRFNANLTKIPEGILNNVDKPTKRELLRVIMSVFDPLGLISPITVRSKILMQEVWRSGIGWDETLRDEEYVGWRSWLKNLCTIRECRIPRCITPAGNHRKTQLHVFCDASLKAYASAAYLRVERLNAPAHVALIMSRNRIAPLKPLSIPRLELQAALLGARLINAIEEQLDIKINERFLWSDSTTVIRWIKTEPRTRQIFVAHRLGEIAELTMSAEWRWVPSKLNPADYATRWSKEALEVNDSWFEGPKFLRVEESDWPAEPVLKETEKSAIDNLESRKALVFTAYAISRDLPITGRLLGWQGLLVAARRVRTVVDRWKGKARAEISVEDILAAEKYWFREIQSDYFSEELKTIRNKGNIQRGSRIASLNPFIDREGILRANGRVTKLSGVQFNNQPIILDAKHPATKHLIFEYHRRFYHASSDAVVNELRQRFYIIGLRNTLRWQISKCLICRLRRAKPQNPQMSTLPTGRVAFRERPFSHCGIDYFGPMFVKVGRRREKRWGVLFTCLTTRAVHLELAHSLNTGSTILALQRLSARRGSPLVIYSDNGTNFKGASKELKNAVAAINTDEQRGHALRRRIKWVFNPPGAPHMGGAWERMIRAVKISLNAILREQAPREEVLQTLLTEIEHSVNSRPLTHVAVDPRDNEALTPNHFLIGASSGAIELGRYDTQALSPQKQWKLAQHFADAFWKRWIREYLPTMIPRKKWHEQESPIKVGDLVLLVDLQAPRNLWRKGTVTEVHPGEDGQVRVAKVRTPTGDLVRPTRKIVKLLGVNENVQEKL